VWSGDWHRCDFKVFRGGDVTRPSNWIRPWLCVWEDFASRVIVGWCLAVRPDTDGLLAAFGEGVMGYGGPLGVVIDNGLDFASKAFAGERVVIDQERIAGVCGALGVVPSFAWKFNPGVKPPESWFRTFCLQVSKTLPTYCGGTPAGRPPELEARLKRGEIAPFTMQDAEGIIRRWIEEVYHVSPHSGDGMNGRSPLQALADNPLPKRTAPEHVLRIMLQKQVRVTVTRRGVRYRDVQYNAYDTAGRCALLPWQGKEVMLLVPYRRDADASTIEVWTLTGEKICEAYNAALDGSSQEHVKELRHRIKGAKRQVREAVAAMRVVSTPLTAQAMMDAQARYAAAQGGARLAAGAESQRDLQLLPGAASLIDQLPTPRSGGCGGRNAPAPLDAVDTPVPRRVEWMDPLDAAAELEGGEESAEGSALDLDGVTFASAEPDHVETSPLDDLPWPMDAAGDADGDELHTMGDTDD
jgi:transposase InsO family protein